MTQTYPTGPPTQPQPWGTPPAPKPKRSKKQKALLIVVGVIALPWIIGSLAGDPTPTTDAPATTAAAAPQADQPATTETPATKATAAPTTAKPKPEFTTSQEQAIGAAQDYLDSQGFSKVGLIDQLSSPYGSDFSKADATVAVNYLKVDWNQQAVRVAKEYLASQHFSRNGLIEQLSSPYGSKFTRAQATYAAGKVGL
jgi:hypothetical protein